MRAQDISPSPDVRSSNPSSESENRTFPYCAIVAPSELKQSVYEYCDGTRSNVLKKGGGNHIVF